MCHSASSLVCFSLTACLHARTKSNGQVTLFVRTDFPALSPNYTLDPQGGPYNTYQHLSPIGQVVMYLCDCISYCWHMAISYYKDVNSGNFRRKLSQDTSVIVDEGASEKPSVERCTHRDQSQGHYYDTIRGNLNDNLHERG